FDRDSIPDPTCTLDDVVTMQRYARTIYIDPAITRYLVELVHATRNTGKYLGRVAPFIEYGASPRASIAFTTAGRALAMIRGRNYVIPEDIKDLAHRVLAHRIQLNFEAAAENITSAQVVDALLMAVPTPCSATTMTVLLNRIKAWMTIHAHRRTRRLLDGDYSSVFHGHSLDFDDLRDYIPGDEIRDIDSKATARHTDPLVKRYVAHRRHILGLVVDTSRDFDAVTSAGADKRHLAILMAGMVGYLAVRHGDDVMLIHGNAERTTASPRKGSEAH